MADDPPRRRVQLRVSNQRAYVWSMEDLAELRAAHHICGVLAGTLPHLSQQNVFLGVPLVLMPEEVVLLVEKQLAVLVDDPKAHFDPSLSQLTEWNATRRENVRAQLAAAEAKEASEGNAKRAMSDAAVRKRREREEKRARVAREKAIAEGLDPDEVVPPPPAAPTPATQPALDLERKDSTNAGAGNAVYAVTVPADSAADLAWYDPSGCTYTTLDDARSAGVWMYPSTPYERAKCEAFRDLWEKGHYMGGGIKFGGDFLVYPGDPLRYHSHFVATVLESPATTLKPMEIVAHGRLGTATKKAHLLCGWDEEKNEVSYYSVEWAGFG